VAVPPGGGKPCAAAGDGHPQERQNKDAAWTVITYLTSKEWEQYQTLKYQTDRRELDLLHPKLAKAFLPPVAGKVFQKRRSRDADIPRPSS